MAPAAEQGAGELGRAWQRWCEARADQLPLPIRRVWHDRKGTHLQFTGTHPNLQFSAYADDNLWTSIHWLGRALCPLYNIDTAPVLRLDGHWHCDFCDPSLRSIYDSKEALWEEELFNPWAEHVRQLLSPGTWALFSKHKGASSSEVWSGENALQKLKQGGYAYAFRTCIEPEKINSGPSDPSATGERAYCGGLTLLI